MQIVDYEQLARDLGADGAALLEHVEGQLINLDGEKIRSVSPHSKGTGGLYILSAWVSERHLCIGQKKVGDKSNEITAIPELIKEMEIKGSTVSIDAIGCQREIARQIVEKQADYLLAVKGNQPDLLEEITESFQHSRAEQTNEEWEYDHGRFENRSCSILTAAKVLSPDLRQAWPSVQTLVKVEALRDVKGIKSTQTRFYISSSNAESAPEYNEMTRGHWSIENQLHWHLDVTFKEDANRSRSGNAPQNLNILRKMALHRIAKDDSKLSKKKRRFKASMNLDYLVKILNL